MSVDENKYSEFGYIWQEKIEYGMLIQLAYQAKKYELPKFNIIDWLE